MLGSRTSWGAWALASVIAACSDTSSGDEAMGSREPGAPCADDLECGTMGRCVESVCRRCGDGTLTPGELCLDQTVLDDTTVSRLFQLRQPGGVALLAFHWNDPRIRLLSRDGRGGLDMQWLLAGSDVYEATSADFDGDGWDDAVFSRINGPVMTPLWVDADGVEIANDSQWTWGPRDEPVAALPPEGAWPAYVLVRADEGLQWWLAFEAGVVAGGQLEVEDEYELAVGDVDGDGSVDLVIATDGGRLAWYRRHEAGFVLADELQLDGGTTSLWVRDVDGDGRGDVVMGSAALVVVRSDAERGLVPDVRLEAPCHDDAAVADLDGDQRPELLMACGHYGLWAFTRDPTGAWSSRPIDFDHRSTALATLDVDEDGLLDVVVGSSGALAVLYADP